MNPERIAHNPELSPRTVDEYMTMFAHRFKLEEPQTQEFFTARDNYLLSIFFKIAESTEGNESENDQCQRFNALYQEGLAAEANPNFSAGQIRYFARITAKKLSADQAHDSFVDILYRLHSETRES